MAIPEDVLLKNFDRSVFIGLLQKYKIQVLLFNILEETFKGEMP
jgi:hypothetical protein